MSHPFGDLLSQHLHRKHGLSQSKLAVGIWHEPATISRMCKGERLTGLQARQRVLAMISWLRQQHALETVEEANALLDAAGMAPVREAELETARLPKLHSKPAPVDRPARTAAAPPTTAEYPLVGRQAEWQALRSAWHKAMRGDAHVVAIAGEAGIGKTRLAEELLDYAKRQGHAVARARAYALEGRLAYAPVADWLRSPALVGRVSALDPVWRSEIARLLPELMSQDATLPPPQPLTERWQLKRLFEALLQVFSVEPGSPILLALDDVQWCDAETLEWLRYLLGAAPRLKLMVAGTVRDEELTAGHPLHKLWRDLMQDGQLTSVSLAPLNPAETTKLGAAVAQHTLMAHDAVRLFQESAGNPLFAIESIRFKQDELWDGFASAASPHASLALPPRVYAVIQHRLAQLSPEARDLAELAAVIGNAFALPLLARASRQDDGAVAQGVDELWQRRLLREQDGARYDFSHDRIRDVAYAEITPGRRRVLHRRVAECIETLYASQIQDVSAQLAVHFEAAGQGERAIPHLMRAIQKSVDLSAMQNALMLVTQGLRITQSLPETGANIGHAIELQLWRGTVLQASRSWIDPQVESAFAEVRRLSAQINDRQSLFLGQNKLRLYHSLRAEWSQAKEIAEQNITLAEEIENPRLLVDACTALGRVHLYQGNLPAARQRFEQAQLTAEVVQPQHEVKSEGHTTGHNLMNLAHCLCLLGYPQQARRRMDEAVAMARGRQDHFALSTIMQFDAILSHMLRDLTAFERAADGMGRLAQQYEFPFSIEMSDLFAGYVLVRCGQHQCGIEKLQWGIQNYERQEFGMFHVHRMGMLVEAHLISGTHAQGLEVCEKALAYADRTGDQFWAPELHRLKGELILGQSGLAREAEASYHQAILLARQQDSRLLELRSGVSLARLWQKQGKGTDAHHFLSDVYGWFTEGFDTADLREAKALLDA